MEIQLHSIHLKIGKPNGIDLNNTTVTVNEGESILFKRSWSANKHSLGTRVYSTNDKKMLVYSGSWGENYG